MPFKSNKQRQWMQNNLPDIADKWQNKYKQGGKLEGHLNGPSHKEGGIKFNLGGELQEAEGGEFVVKKNSVNPNTAKVLEYINETGSVPQYKCGGHVSEHAEALKLNSRITDSRKRRT